jgi:hypothetical protein
MSSNLQWSRIVVGAVLLEVALIIAFVPLLHLALFNVTVIAPFLPVVAFILGFVISSWLVRKVKVRPSLHGLLIGVLATVLYIAMCTLQPGGITSVVAKFGPAVFFSGNLLRILGCAACGFTAHKGVRSLNLGGGATAKPGE